ncbi:hypothetical protein [Deinococcus multiflagellatus]|uniref:Uncharacterized protein n=1 Tax=Deinococcus multiflagellatus TaxID=1656887 RepID=A0ABW1ZGL0_9DEIO|nr:hypothetical protein [Deinococcus multiflagellatus]MBZ9712142.1 hypothetical protein [Deinococcus multiflagellatus]
MTFSLRAFSLGLLLAGSALAQPAGSDLFSRLTEGERALLLAAAGVSAADAFRPGQLPSAVPFRLPTLPGQNLLGSVVRPDTMLVVVRSAATPEAAQLAANKALSAEGWRAQYEDTPEGDRVFALSTAEAATTSVRPQCKPGVPGALTVSASAVPGGSQVVYSFYTFAGMSALCPASLEWTDPAYQNYFSPGRGVPSRDPLAALRATGLVLPSLPAPAGARVSPAGSSFGESSYSTYATVRTAQAPVTVLDHYLGALRAQGWVPATTKRSTEGLWTVALTARQGGRERRATLSVMPRTEPANPGAAGLNRVDVQFAVGDAF